MTIALIEHVELDSKGRARIVGTRTKVMQIVMVTQNGYSPAEIHKQYPHLSLSQIYAALSYYHDHQELVDQQIEESWRYAEEMRAKHPNPFTREELLARLAKGNKPEYQ